MSEPFTTDRRDPALPDRRQGTTTVPKVEISGRTMWQAVGVVLATLVLLRAATAASTILVMVALSFFFSLALDPAVRWLHDRFGWRRGSAVGVIYVAGLVSLGFLVWVLVPALQTLADEIAANAEEWLANLNTWTEESFGFPVTSDEVAADADAVGVAVGNFADEPFGAVVGIAAAGVSLVFQLATIAMFTFYFTADAPRIKRALLRLFHPATQERIAWTWDQAIVQTGGYFYSRSVLMVINGAGFLVTMVLVGVPLQLAIPLAVFAGFVSVFIPAIGTYIGSAIPILVTLALQGLVPALIVLGYALVYQQLENYWLSPKISADTMSLSGGLAFGAALAGGAIAGPIGAFVALPVTALIAATISNYARSHEVVVEAAATEEELPGSRSPTATPVVGATPVGTGHRGRARRRARR